MTFIIPVRHHQNMRSPSSFKRNLGYTLQSLVNQSSSSWNAVIICNSGTELPRYSDKIHVHTVDFAPHYHDFEDTSKIDEWRDAIRLDKGKRIQAGLRACSLGEYVMFVDDDDFVHRRLVEFVERNAGKPGWYVRDGFIWEEGSRYLFKKTQFHKLCGTSHVVRKDVLEMLREDFPNNDDYVKSYLGSHVRLRDRLSNTSYALEALPFPGAIYRTLHPNSFGGERASKAVNRKLSFRRRALAEIGISDGAIAFNVILRKRYGYSIR